MGRQDRRAGDSRGAAWAVGGCERSLDWLVSSRVDRAVIAHADLALARTLAPVSGMGS